MQEWINVKYHSNQVYMVSKSAINDVVTNTIKATKYFKMLSSSTIKVDEDHNELQVILDLKISKNKLDVQASLIKELVSSLQNQIKKLIIKKPKNIQVVLLGTF
ncbi:hypothetical protein MBVR141_0440 [Mycoplasmopsis bovirhinis]|uniref:MMB_0454 family protein n=1 Tax=Mycoplasmopsis bovirhinis TaxID=29553 RepID=UPI000BB9D6CC|nr:hypothetical protein [Mycoplasmopsis bovirhinis]BBA22305.1 hypothetical protein MBVR141_0440 [Mycoplasmopsis bovirhinis]